MKVKVVEDLCIGCEVCIAICPVGAISLQKEKAVITGKCVGCGACVSDCPQAAIEIIK